MRAEDDGEIAAFKAFRDFDGNWAAFGDEELPVTGTEAANNSVYAALDSRNPNRLTLVVINKTDAATPFHFAIHGFVPSSARAYAVTSDHLSAPEAAAVDVRDGHLLFDAPPLSVTTIEATHS